ncbi:hypothetical protein [Lacinutrix chionoecetis]
MTKGRKIFIFALFCLLIIGFLYKYSPRRIEFLGHYDKVFPHKVNSLQKQKEALKYFNGVELDLVYHAKEDFLEVNHPPDKTIGLTFKSYLEQIEANTFPFLWLDIKKLDTTNAEAILFKLNALFDKKNYPKNKILIETQQPETLVDFVTFGYKTSYYLKPGLINYAAKDLKTEIAYIDSILKAQPEIGISSSFEDYNVLRNNFPEKTKYIWAITSAYKPRFKTVNTILKDTTVAIVLSQFNSFGGNR